MIVGPCYHKRTIYFDWKSYKLHANSQQTVSSSITDSKKCIVNICDLVCCLFVFVLLLSWQRPRGILRIEKWTCTEVRRFLKAVIEALLTSPTSCSPSASYVWWESHHITHSLYHYNFSDHHYAFSVMIDYSKFNLFNYNKVLSRSFEWSITKKE